MKRRKKLKEVKAEHARKKRKVMRRRRAFALLGSIFTLCILLGIGYLMQNWTKIQKEFFDKGDIQVNEGAEQEGYQSIVLFGGDSREGVLGAGTHADTIIIASIHNETKEVKLVSVYRDLLTMQVDGKLKKANSAYFAGGAKDAINMLNLNFDLDIQDYVTVDFAVVVDVVDALGGIEIDVSDAEAAEVNNHIDGTGAVVGKEAIHIKGGYQKLDGVQALTYARIRKNVGGDYARTERQRLVISKVVEKAKKMNLSTLNELIDTVFPRVSTSLSLTDVLALATNFTQYQLGETSGFAFEHIDGHVEGLGSVVVPLGVIENVEELHTFLYPEDQYTVSNKVKEIALEIEDASGYTRADYEDTNTGSDSSE